MTTKELEAARQKCLAARGIWAGLTEFYCVLPPVKEAAPAKTAPVPTAQAKTSLLPFLVIGAVGVGGFFLWRRLKKR